MRCQKYYKRRPFIVDQVTKRAHTLIASELAEPMNFSMKKKNKNKWLPLRRVIVTTYCFIADLAVIITIIITGCSAASLTP